MGKQLRSVVITSAALLMLAIQPSWGAQNNNQGQNNNNQGQQGNQAPEIDIGAGGAGLTVLAIALLLAAERRSRSS